MNAKDEGAFDTVTFRIPAVQKANIRAAAESSHLSETAIIRAALDQFLGGDVRTSELAGFRKEFSEFLGDGQKAGRRRAILLVIGADRARRVYEGFIDYEYSIPGSGIVAIAREGGAWIIPRAHVVGWFSEVRMHKQLLTSLAFDGWQIVTMGAL